MSKKFLLLILFLFVAILAFSQQRDQVVQFSGLVMSSDSLQAIPFVNIYNITSNRGAVTNYQGFFSMVAARGDTIRFSNLGYKKAQYIVPENLTEKKYSIIQLMTRDTIHLDETVVYPWPTIEQFREAFLSLDIPDDDLERARKNLEREKLREIGIAMLPDAAEINKQFIRNQAASYYYYKQQPPIHLLNPFAWAEFFNAWQRGDFRRD